MSKRQVLRVPGVEHTNPIPMGVKIGNMVFSSSISGKDPATGEVPNELESEFFLAFNNMVSLLQAGGCTTDDVARITIYIPHGEYKKYVNTEWLRLFPDPHNRPSRKVLNMSLPKPLNVQLEVIAVC